MRSAGRDVTAPAAQEERQGGGLPGAPPARPMTPHAPLTHPAPDSKFHPARRSPEESFRPPAAVAATTREAPSMAGTKSRVASHAVNSAEAHWPWAVHWPSPPSRPARSRRPRRLRRNRLRRVVDTRPCARAGPAGRTARRPSGPTRHRRPGVPRPFARTPLVRGGRAARRARRHRGPAPAHRHGGALPGLRREDRHRRRVPGGPADPHDRGHRLRPGLGVETVHLGPRGAADRAGHAGTGGGRRLVPAGLRPRRQEGRDTCRSACSRTLRVSAPGSRSTKRPRTRSASGSSSTRHPSARPERRICTRT
ncbi:hypothetical protein SHIRM173S_05557 [Streptomyces hirsutus]